VDQSPFATQLACSVFLSSKFADIVLRCSSIRLRYVLFNAV
jgi:hypothetical protein